MSSRIVELHERPSSQKGGGGGGDLVEEHLPNMSMSLARFNPHSGIVMQSGRKNECFTHSVGNAIWAHVELSPKFKTTALIVFFMEVQF